MLASAAVFAVMLTGQVVSALQCPSRDVYFIDHIEEEAFVDNFIEFDVYGSEDAEVVIDKLSDAGEKSQARYVFNAVADGKYAVVWDSVEQKVVNCKTMITKIHRDRNCQYYVDTEATKACREASAIAEFDVWGDDAEIDVSKFTITTDEFSSTKSDTTATGANLNLSANQSNQIINANGDKSTPSATIIIRASGQNSKIKSLVTTTVDNRGVSGGFKRAGVRVGKRAGVSGEDQTSTRSRSRSFGRRGL